MFVGTLEAIFYAEQSDHEMSNVDSIDVQAGKGIVQDRYATGKGTFYKPIPDRQITLIEAEAVEAVGREYDFELTPEETRRNLVTRNVPLNHLVGREFFVGNVRIKGIRLCEPCAHLEKLTGKKVMSALMHRGGLRAQVLSDGAVRVGQEIRIAEA